MNIKTYNIMNASIQNSKLHFPSALTWMWNYCIYLGPYTSSKGVNYDMGICIEDGEVYAAIVTGNNPGDYLSGDLAIMGQSKSYNELYDEVIIRAKALNLF